MITYCNQNNQAMTAHCNQFSDYIMCMSQEWLELSKPWERLQWARARWLSSTGAVRNSARFAAESMGMSPSTYAQYERPEGQERHAKLTPSKAAQFARKFKVNWVWLLTGEGTPFDIEKSEPILRIENTIRALTPDEQERAAILLEAAFGKKAG